MVSRVLGDLLRSWSFKCFLSVNLSGFVISRGRDKISPELSLIKFSPNEVK